MKFFYIFLIVFLNIPFLFFATVGILASREAGKLEVADGKTECDSSTSEVLCHKSLGVMQVSNQSYALNVIILCSSAVLMIASSLKIYLYFLPS